MRSEPPDANKYIVFFSSNFFCFNFYYFFKHCYLGNAKFSLLVFYNLRLFFCCSIIGLQVEILVQIWVVERGESHLSCFLGIEELF